MSDKYQAAKQFPKAANVVKLRNMTTQEFSLLSTKAVLERLPFQ